MQSGERVLHLDVSYHPQGHRATSAVGVPLELNRAWASQPDTCCHMTYTPWANKGILCIINLFALIVVQQSNLVLVYQLLTPRSQLSVQLSCSVLLVPVILYAVSPNLTSALMEYPCHCTMIIHIVQELQYSTPARPV